MKPIPHPAFITASVASASRLPGHPMFQPSHWRLSHQLWFSSLLVTLLLMLVAGYWINHLEEREHLHAYHEALTEKFNLLRATSLDALISKDIPVLNSIVEAAGKKDARILSLQIFDRAGGSLAQWQSNASGSPTTPLAMEAGVEQMGENFGRLHVVWNTAPRLSEIQKHTHNLIFILTLLLLSLAFCLIFLTRLLVVRPIRLLHESLQTEHLPEERFEYAARELQRVGDAVSVLLRLKTEIKRSEQRYRGLFDNMTASCMVLSNKGDHYAIEDMNESCRCLPVLAIGERRVSRLGEVLDEDKSAVVYAALRNAAVNQAHCHIGEFSLSRDGHDYCLDCHVFALDAGDLVLMLRDITESKISQDLRRAKEAAEQANELKSAFLASMSHEIRTPLNGVLSMVELLRGTRLCNKQRHWVEAIRGSGQLLLSTINDILDFSRIEAGRLQLEDIRFSLGEVIGNLFNATSQRAYGKGLELVLHQAPGLPDRLIGDPFRLQQILINLVGNAIKFTTRGSVTIILSKQDILDGRLLLCVEVRDSGVGIAAEQIERIFQPFEQGVANRFLFSEGTGLGLAISKRLVDAMGGAIGVESQLGEGSVFHFEVPVGADEQPALRWLAPDNWRQCPALICVQHEAVRESIVHTLNSFGFQTCVAASIGDTAHWNCQADRENCACLIILDDSLIGQAGTDLLTELKTRSGAVRQFVLYVVNMFNRDKGELDCLDDLPDTAFLMKPVHASGLLNALQQLFGLTDELPSTATKLENLSWETLIERLGARERLSGARILLAEDNLVNREVAEEALSMVGIDVEIAINGEDAVNRVRNGNTFDAVLMDLQMPVMDGFQATEIIRQHFDMNTLPIIAMTAGVLFKDRQRSLEVGMNDHVGKPVNLQNLMETLMKWVKPAHPRPFKASRASRSALPPLERALAVAGEVDWATVELPGLKIFKGLNRLGGDQKLYFKLVKSFAKAHEDSEPELLTALANADAQTLRRLAHTLKGVAATLGAESLHESAASLERAALSGPTTSQREAVETLVPHLKEALSSIKALLKSTRTPDRGELRCGGALSAVGAVSEPRLYADILGLLGNRDTRLQDICAANQTTIRAWFACGETYEHFMDGIEHYRFEAAGDLFTSHAVVSIPAEAESVAT